MRPIWRSVLVVLTGLNTLVLGPALACAEMSVSAPSAAMDVSGEHAHHHPAPSDAPSDEAPSHSASCALAVGCLVAVATVDDIAGSGSRASHRVAVAGPSVEHAQPSRAPEPPPPRG